MRIFWLILRMTSGEHSSPAAGGGGSVDQLRRKRALYLHNAGESGIPSSRDRHSGPHHAAADDGHLRPRLAGATTPPQWPSFPGCTPVLQQTDSQLGFVGGGRGCGR